MRKSHLPGILIGFVSFIAVSFALTVSCLAVSTNLRGDVNDDQKLSSADYVIVKRGVLQTYKLDAFQACAGDVNDDGKVASADYIQLKRVILHTFSFKNKYKDYSSYVYSTPVTYGKTYSVSKNADEKYPDSKNFELTDSLLADRDNSGYYNSRLSGYPLGAGNPLRITVSLEKKISSLYRFQISYLCTHEDGIGPIKKAAVEISDDGVKWTTCGEATIPEEKTGMQTATLELSEKVSAKYIRYTVSGNAYWVFLDEVSAFADILENSSQNSSDAVIQAAYTSDNRQYHYDDLISGTPDRTKSRVCISDYRTYSVNPAASIVFDSDNDGKLTDCLTGTSTEGDNWVVLSAAQDISVTLDFAEVRHDIAAFEIHAGNNRNLNIDFPTYLLISASQDGKTWADIGRCYAVAEDRPVFTYTLELSNTISARYIRFSLPQSTCKYYYLDEIRIFSYGDNVSTGGFYPDVSFPNVDKNLYWSSSSKDYTSRIDLLAGLPQQIEMSDGSGIEYPDDNTPASSAILTDGVYSSATNIHNGFFFKFHGAGGRNIYYDLTRLSSLQSFSVSFTSIPSWGVYVPENVSIYLSEDAKTWYLAGKAVPTSREDYVLTKATLSLTTPIAARFICFNMGVGGWIGIDEIDAYGTKKITAATKTLASSGFEKKLNPAEQTEWNWAHPSSDLLGGASDIFLAYHGSSSYRTEEDLLYQIGYYGTDGEIQDTMFDGILFLMSGGFPSGLGGGTGGILNYNKSDAEWLVNELYTKNRNIIALESAAGKLKSTLGLPSSYKVKYYVSLYQPSADTFGDIDGDGKDENTSTVQGKIKILRWCIDLFEKEMAKHSFKNIVFGGYYWYNESMASDGSDIEVVNSTADYVHSYSSQLFWIPYYSARGWNNWKDYGLDSCCLQPNYAFNFTVPESRLYQAALNASNLGMSIEIEMDSRVESDSRYIQRYFSYLKSGADLGFMKSCIHIYYMSSGSLSRFANSSKQQLRMIYDYTYQFIKGTLESHPEKIPDRNIQTVQKKSVSGKLNTDSDNPLFFRLYESPKHGTVTLTEDGNFTYYPDHGYSGTDSFTVVASRLLGESDPSTISIQIS